MAGLSTGAEAAVVKVYHEKSMILPDVSRVLACLYEKDVKFECVKGSYKDILRLQAARSVPVPFYDGPTFLQESRAICRYIAETYEQRGYPFLLGKDVLERASIEQWLRHEEHAFDPPSRALFCHLAFPLHDEDNDDIDREKRKLEEVLEVYEQRLGESEFLAGNEFTLADLVHLPNTHHTVTSEKFAYLYDSRKNVLRWWNTISARDSWQQVLWYMKSVEEQYQMEELEVAAKDAQGETASGARDITKEAREADQRRVTSAPTQELPSSVQNGQQQSKAPPTDLKVSDSSPLEAEFKEDIQGAMSGDERFSTKRLRKMFEESEAEAPKSDSTDLQAPVKEETPSIYKTPSDEQDRKMQAPVKEETPSIYKTPSDEQDRKMQLDTVLADGTTGTPSSGTRVPDTPISADERKATSQPKGDQASDQAPPLPSFADTRNNKTGIAEAGRTNTIAPDEQPGGRIPKNAGAPAAGPSPMKSQKNMNEAYNDGPSIQQLSNDQSGAQLAENKTKHGDDATPLTEIGKPKEDDFLVNANQNNTGQAQVASTDGPSKLQMQSDQNKPISSKDIGKRNNETVSYRSSATSREMLPSVPEKSMGENQLQGDKSSISLQDNVKQGSEAALSVSGTEQPKKRDLLANADQNSGKTPGEALQMSEEQNTSDTQQMKSNTSNSKSDGSSKPTQFDGNEGNLPESQRHGSSTNP